MSSTEPSSSIPDNNKSPSDKPLSRAQTIPLTTTTVEIIGQVPEPLSPSDKKPGDNSLDAAIAQQKAQADTHQIEVEATENASGKGINLPLPASSSLVEPEQAFSRPLRTQTTPATLTTSSGEPVSPQALTSSKTFPVAPSIEPNPTMSGQQPLIAELPGTPVLTHTTDAEAVKMDREISLEQSARLKATKSEDAAVIYDIPITPSAQAFEIANKGNVGKGYFEPVFPGSSEEKKEAAKVEAA